MNLPQVNYDLTRRCKVTQEQKIFRSGNISKIKPSGDDFVSMSWLSFHVCQVWGKGVFLLWSRLLILSKDTPKTKSLRVFLCHVFWRLLCIKLKYFCCKEIAIINFRGHLTTFSLLWIIYLKSSWHLSTCQFILTQEWICYHNFQMDIN